MSENKTAADAPAMARATRRRIIGEQSVLAVYADRLDEIAALPPAPLPADVAAELAAFRAVLYRLVTRYVANAGSAHQFVSCITPDDNMRMWDDAYVLLGGALSPDRKIGRYYEDSREYRLAELHKPAMTEAEQQKEATDGRR